MPKPKQTSTRQRLLDEGRKALLTHGYDGVGLGAILAAAGVPKGSFYHFFNSKEEFAEAVLDDYEQPYIVLRKRFFDSPTLSAVQRLSTYLDELGRLHRGEAPLGGCLFGVMAQTASTRSPAFRARLASIFATWTVQIEQLLAEARAAGEIGDHIDPKTAAAFLIDAYEGALVRMKVDGGSGAFERFRLYAFVSLTR